MKNKIPLTFRKRMLLCNFLTIICIAFSISMYSFSSYQKNTITRESENSVSRLHALSERLTVACEEMVNILQNCSGRKSLFLTSSLHKGNVLTQEETDVYAANVLRDFCAISGYSQYIYKLAIYRDDASFLQAGTAAGNRDDDRAIMSAPWFEELLHKNMQEYNLNLVDNPFPLENTRTPHILPMLRPLQYIKNKAPEDAWVLLAVSPKLFQDALNVMPADKSLVILTEQMQPVGRQNMERFSTAELSAFFAAHPEPEGSVSIDLSGEACILNWNRLPVSGLTLVELLPLSGIPLDWKVIYTTVLLVFIFSIAVGLVLSLMFTRYLTRPVTAMIEHLNRISAGQFTRNPAIETNDELGIIGRQINEMSGHIATLMDSRVADEKEKMNMEIKMLQAQINPHFLYNTLDSIKWIATMQHNAGIVKVVSALSSLLKNMAKGFNEKVTVRQELEFLDHYVTIEKIRYIELFDIEIDVEDPALYEARIVKLSLQPIVENSIFSGIEPSGNPGLIRIRVFSREGTLYISIRDNGIGMSPERIAHILTDTNRVTKHYMSGIGLPNVDRRLKLVYGEAYGLSIESIEGEYTCVTLSLPLEYES